MTTRITIRKPDDWHLHVRDGAMLKAVMPFTAKHFGRAILMPNLVPPVVTTKDAIAYRERVMAALPPGSPFKPLMTCYLTDDTDPDDVERGFKEGVFTAVKLYPAHATRRAGQAGGFRFAQRSQALSPAAERRADYARKVAVDGAAGGQG
jgi:dihydroorotase